MGCKYEKKNALYITKAIQFELKEKKFRNENTENIKMKKWKKSIKHLKIIYKKKTLLKHKL